MYSLLFLAALPGQFVNDPAFKKETQQAVLEATVRVQHPASSGEGTGVVVARAGGGAREGQVVYILTAAHIVPEGRPGSELVDLAFFTADSLPKPSETVPHARILRRMPGVDLALIMAKVEKPAKAVVPICPPGKEPNNPTPRAPWAVLTAGIEGNDAVPVLRVDKVRAEIPVLKPDQTRAFHYEADYPPPQGRSGGPLVDKNGYLLGICSGTRDTKDGKRGYYVSLPEIQIALKKIYFDHLYKDAKAGGGK